MGCTTRRRCRVRAAALLIGSVALAGCGAHGTGSSTATLASEKHPQTAWVACNRNPRAGKPSTFTPLLDAQAAALVTPQPEVRPANSRPYVLNGRPQVAANAYVPATPQIDRFRAAKTSAGQTMVQFNPYLRFVDGRDGLHHPTTGELIQWSAHKWGIPENWLRAEYVLESYWNQFQLGDRTPVSGSWYGQYPSLARVPHSHAVYQSLGITQVKWLPNGAVGAGTEPLRWESTAFNLDYQAATIRFYYDDPSGARSSWGDSSYAPCQTWRSLGGWYDPYPWHNAGQSWYIGKVQGNLADGAWASAGFKRWSPSSSPAGVRLR